MEHVVGAAVVDNDELVDADAVAAATTHTARKLLHASWSMLFAPPSLSMTALSTPTLSLTMWCSSTPTLWPPPRTRRSRRCAHRGVRCWCTVGASGLAAAATVFVGGTAGHNSAAAAAATSSSVTAACAAGATRAYRRVRVARTPNSAGDAGDGSSTAGVREGVGGGSTVPRCRREKYLGRARRPPRTAKCRPPPATSACRTQRREKAAASVAAAAAATRHRCVHHLTRCESPGTTGRFEEPWLAACGVAWRSNVRDICLVRQPRPAWAAATRRSGQDVIVSQVRPPFHGVGTRPRCPLESQWISMVSSRNRHADEVTHANRSVRLSVIYSELKQVNPTLLPLPTSALFFLSLAELLDLAKTPVNQHDAEEKKESHNLYRIKTNATCRTHVGATVVPARRPGPVYHRHAHVRGGGAPAGRPHLPARQHPHAREGDGAEEIDGPKK